MRWLPRVAVLAAGIAAALTVATPPSSANATITDLRQAPADFSQVMGYQPTTGWLADGTERLINPSGSCSVPGEGRSFNFVAACQAHDFGYDLLRYAERKHVPLPGTARDEIDRRFTADLHTQCGLDNSVATCDAAVTVFAAAVAFNSWRQLSGPPVSGSGITRTAGLLLLAGTGLALAIRVLLIRRRFRPPLPRLPSSAGSAG